VRSFERARSRWENNMKRCLKITGDRNAYFINLVMQRGKGKFIVTMVIKLQVP
jgi:hypothetical protein